MKSAGKTTSNRREKGAAPSVLAREFIRIRGLAEFRAFAASVLRVAMLAEENARHEVVLVLEEPAIGSAKLKDEWNAAEKIIRPEIWQRMVLMMGKGGELDGLPAKPSMEEWAQAVAAADAPREGPLRRERGGEVFHDILRVLVRQWMERGGAVSGKWLCEQAGCSHPTLTRALRRLAKYLTGTRPPVALARFPTDEWRRLIDGADRIRCSRRFAAATGDLTVDALGKSVRALRRDDVWLGGVAGARHYFPALDLIGTPRLDVTMPCTSRQPDVSWVEPLGLRPAMEGEAVMLAVHAVHFPGARCEKSGGRRWADRVECLLDLHDARLEAQALDFLRHCTETTSTP
jgi:hypothetical protein